jgi:hypothetical protein
MGHSELRDFAEELMREVRDDSVGQIARYLAGLYGHDHPMVPCWQREMPGTAVNLTRLNFSRE